MFTRSVNKNVRQAYFSMRGVCTSIPRGPAARNRSAVQSQTHAGVAHLVERHLAKVEVAGSSPVARSTKDNRSK